MTGDEYTREFEALKSLLAGRGQECLFDVDLEILLKLSRRFCVSQKLAPLLEDTAVGPEAILDRKRCFITNSIHMQCAVEAAKIFDVLRVDHVFLKGAALFCDPVRVDMADRLMADVDVLIKEDDFSRVHRALVEGGFLPWKRRAPLDTAWIRANVSHFNYTYKNGSCLEVHVRLLGRSTSLNSEPFIESRTKREGPLGMFLYVPRPEILAAHLLFHALDQHSVHPVIQVKTAVDLNDILNSCRDNFDVEMFLDNTGLSRDIVFSYIAFLKGLVKDSALDFLPSERGEETFVFESSFKEALGPSWVPPRFEPPAAVERFFSSDGVRGRLRALLEVLFPPPAKLAYVHDVPIFSFRLLFEYIKRPVYLLSKLDVGGVRFASNMGRNKRMWGG